ncbi:unnamed protein product [Eruca vesicaria subsp. sativa]|uniref:Uncharacterized protein n=1 Tax=Eruca vesicaria subsp. sativa TaxID=29727 RepID=A0ABC8JMI7_ERUVS|nr:unnamed protein product [Eruca vesicaria subsp. sativa]
MVIYSILLADLKVECCSNTTEVHLLRFWEARNVRKGGELKSLDMLLIDENVSISFPINAVDDWFHYDFLQNNLSFLTVAGYSKGSVNTNRQFMFRQHLSEGSVYRLSGFDVTRNNLNFRMDAPFSIRFNNRTSLVKKTTFIRLIPTAFSDS